jgi:asparagine synthase (glutamine-hydrolysing)
MCGIVGFINCKNYRRDDSVSIIHKMNKSLNHRGPDDEGIWVDQDYGIAFGHRRLSVIDVSRGGAQPMVSSNGRFIISYNGEVYNYKKIKKKLEENGKPILLKGRSDTEIILAAIERWGMRDSLSLFVGMFAFALWDRKLNTLSLARDRFGEKPLYYGIQKNTFMFSSELNALKNHPEFLKQIDRNVIPLLLRHNCIPAPYSIYKGIYKLKPGHIIEIQFNYETHISKLKVKSKSYWEINDNDENETNTFVSSTDRALSELDRLLNISIKGQRISDVPLGVFLSGGVDSSIIAAIAQSQSKNAIKTFTIGNHDMRYNEAGHAKKISQYLGTDHTELYISPNDALDLVPKLGAIYDEPFSDSSQIPTYLISKLAREQVTVALSGDGGDEIFGGYNRYTWVPKIWEKIKYIHPSLRESISKTLRRLPYSDLNNLYGFINSNFWNNDLPIDFGERIHKFAEVLPMKSPMDIYYTLCSHWKNPENVTINCTEYSTRLSKLKNNKSTPNISEYMMLMDIVTFLPDDILVKVDRASMANSLEVRAPFLDHRVFNFAKNLPTNMKFQNSENKWLLRQLLYNYIPKKLLVQRKMGFSIPIGEWLRGPLRVWAEHHLNESRLAQDGYFDKKQVKQMWQEHLTGRYNWQYQLWDILMFQSWHSAHH